jgi:hypothetical protein
MSDKMDEKVFARNFDVMRASDYYCSVAIPEVP